MPCPMILSPAHLLPRVAVTLVALAGQVGLAGQAGAQQAGADAAHQQWGPVDSRDASYLRTLEDIDVRNVDGDKIGEIEGVLIDAEGKPAAFHIEMGGFLDIGDADVAVPIAAFVYERGSYVSKMTETQLRNLPEWDD